MADTHNEYRFVVVGSGGVGKSAITVRFIEDQFVKRYDPTIEDSYIKQIEIDGVACVIDIMDTAGQEEYRALRDSYMKNGQGFVLVYSVTSRVTFNNAKKIHIDILRIKENSPDIPVLMVGNKIDLKDQREVSKEDGERIAQELGIYHHEASAKTAEGVSEIFLRLVRMVNKW
eukprot:CAMPEP_0174255740 /NCGR_PEP_ID=MMETSP0439-20130205/5052_1 /TAXON_ID=0 /ORGANISM="Stereomyxa ramosa, Strain Chinc5" /LENGTH=172 /DNA_ID=CAMNT_0015338059 /DNA_START=57 /DNA_END=572 /DNA_ORIENTATION=-